MKETKNKCLWADLCSKQYSKRAAINKFKSDNYNELC